MNSPCGNEKDYVFLGLEIAILVALIIIIIWNKKKQSDRIERLYNFAEQIDGHIIQESPMSNSIVQQPLISGSYNNNTDLD